MFLIPAFLIFRPLMQGVLLSGEGEKPQSSVLSTQDRSTPDLSLSRKRCTQHGSTGTAQLPAPSSLRLHKKKKLGVCLLCANAKPHVPCPTHPPGSCLAAAYLPGPPSRCPRCRDLVPGANGARLGPWVFLRVRSSVLELTSAGSNICAC